MGMNRLLLASLLLLSTISASADSDDKRIAAARGKLASGMLTRYAGQLDKLLLETGIGGIEVFVADEKHKTTLKSEQYPSLTVFGFLDRSIVYKMAADLDVIGDARRLGFKTVDFYSKTSEGRWLFDLSKRPSCDRGICF
jgi:hypothetical protein